MTDGDGMIVFTLLNQVREIESPFNYSSSLKHQSTVEVIKGKLQVIPLIFRNLSWVIKHALGKQLFIVNMIFNVPIL